MRFLSCRHTSPSVGWSVRRSVGPSVHQFVVIETISIKRAFFDAAVIMVSVYERPWGEGGYGWRLHTPARPSTIDGRVSGLVSMFKT